MKRAILSFALLTGVRLAAQVPAEVRGRVTDDATGRAIVGAEIAVVGRGEHAETDADGAFVIRGLEPRHYRLRARSVGYAPTARDADVDNGRVTAVDFSLRAVNVVLDPVTISAAADAHLAGATTLDRRAIESSGRHDVGELLQTVPSVVLTQSGGPGSPTQISIRGSSAGEVLVLVDGVPINSAITGTADLSRIALETVERVTVVPGAQSAKYGARAQAGVVLIETRRAERDASLSASMGAWGERVGALSVGDVVPVRDARLGGSISAQQRAVIGDFSYDVPAIRGGGTARRTNADVRSSSVVGATSLEAGRMAARGRIDWEETARGVAGSIVQPSSTGRARESRFAGGIDSRATLGGVLIGGTVDLANERSHFVDPDPPFSGAYDDRVDAHEARTALNATIGGMSGLAALGVESRQVGVDATSLASGTPHSQAINSAWIDFRRTMDASHEIALSAEATARIDHESLGRNTSTSPRLSMTASRGIASVSLSGGGAFSPPSLADQFFHEGVLVKPNPALQPERVRNEIELRGALRDVALGRVTTSVDAAVYRADIHGMILWTPDFRFIWSPSNFDVRRSGWEATARVALASLGTELSGTIDQTDVTYTGSVLSGQVAYRPRTTGNVGLAVGGRRGRIELTTRYVGARRTVPGSELNSLDPYWLTDAIATLPLSRHAWAADATFGVTNVFDKPAAMLVDYPFGGRRWTVGIRVRRSGGALETSYGTN